MIGDYLVFLRRIASTKTTQAYMTTSAWIHILLLIAGYDMKSGKLLYSDVIAKVIPPTIES